MSMVVTRINTVRKVEQNQLKKDVFVIISDDIF